jgi:hypothetical protein
MRLWPRPNAEKILNLTGNVNPYYSRRLKRFTEIAIGPLLGLDLKKLDQTKWRKLREQFLPYRDWCAFEPDGAVEKLPPEKMDGRHFTLAVKVQDREGHV